MKLRFYAVLLLALLVAAAAVGLRFWSGAPLHILPLSPPDYERYDYGVAEEARIMDVGTQPNAMTELATESLFHDRILERQLAAAGWKLREHRYRTGSDMLPYSDGRLDVMFLGDTPALVAMAKHQVGVFALCRQGRDTIIARRPITASQLKGLRIGYPANTTAHFMLRRTLLAVNLTLDDVITVALSPEQMESALRLKQVDAVVVWQPTASRLLAIPRHVAVAAADKYSYLAMDLNFAARHPDLQRAILAAAVRAAEWTRQDDDHIRSQLRWAREAGKAFLGTSPFEVNDRWVRLAREETIGNASFPMLPLDSGDESGALHQQFEFLKKSGSVPATVAWPTVQARIDTALLPTVIANAAAQTDRFDYAPRKLHQEDGAP